MGPETHGATDITAIFEVEKRCYEIKWTVAFDVANDYETWTRKK